jgi:hypothetical protein
VEVVFGLLQHLPHPFFQHHPGEHRLHMLSIAYTNGHQRKNAFGQLLSFINVYLRILFVNFSLILVLLTHYVKIFFTMHKIILMSLNKSSRLLNNIHSILWNDHHHTVSHVRPEGALDVNRVSLSLTIEVSPQNHYFMT